MLHAVHHGNNNRALCEAMLNMLYGVIGAPALGGYQQMLNLSGVLHRLAVKEMRRRAGSVASVSCRWDSVASRLSNRRLRRLR